jgi:hypothetical protein
MRFLGALGCEFGAGDEENGAGDEHHEECAGDGHSREPAGDRAECGHVERIFHYHSPGASGRSGYDEQRTAFLPFRLRDDSGDLVNLRFRLEKIMRHRV